MIRGDQQIVIVMFPHFSTMYQQYMICFVCLYISFAGKFWNKQIGEIIVSKFYLLTRINMPAAVLGDSKRRDLSTVSNKSFLTLFLSCIVYYGKRTLLSEIVGVNEQKYWYFFHIMLS